MSIASEGNPGALKVVELGFASVTELPGKLLEAEEATNKHLSDVLSSEREVEEQGAGRKKVKPEE